MKLLKESEYTLTEKDLLDRANKVIKSAKNNSVEGVIEIFEQIAVPFDKENYKKELFHMIFDLANIDNEWSEETGFLIPSRKRTKKTVVSHMDLIPKFNKGFRDNNVCQVKDDKLIGALDNTFTNAVVINHILNNQNINTSYLFTLDEETTQYAIRDYMVQYGTEQFIINLDTTNDGWNHNTSIEYDEPCYQICKQIEENLDLPYFTKDRVCDDLDEVIKAKGKGFSYCIPTNKVIHSYNNYTMIDKIEPYMKGLEYIVNKMSLKETTYNIKYMNIDEGLEYKTIKKLKKVNKNKELEETSNNQYELTYFSEPDNPNDTDPYYSSHKTEHIGWKKNENENENKNINVLSNLIIGLLNDDSGEIQSFLNKNLYNNDFFRKEDLTNIINDKNSFFNELYYLNIITKVSANGYYEFNHKVKKSTPYKIYEILEKSGDFDGVRFYRYLYQYAAKKISVDFLELYQKSDKVDKAKVKVIKELLKKNLIKEIKNNKYKIKW